MKATALLLTLALAGFGVGCGDDGGTGSDTGTDTSDPDTGDDATDPPETDCPNGEDATEKVCCQTHENGGIEGATYRLAAVSITTPVKLVPTELVGRLLQEAIDANEFNWLLEVAEGGAEDGAVTVKTGYGLDNTGSFSFCESASELCRPDEFGPVNLTGTLTGNTMTSEVLDSILTVPVLKEEWEEGEDPFLTTLPLRALQIVDVEASENADCIGSREERSWESGGQLKAFITVDDAEGVEVAALGLETTLCNLLTGMLVGTDPCTDRRADWPEADRPDSLCDGNDCTRGECDQDTECNAWALEADIAGQAVPIQ